MPPLVIRTLELRISGMSESELDQTIAPIYKQYENPVTTILAHNGDMQVHLRARCATEGEAMRLLAEVGGKIDAALGDRIYSRNGDPLEAVVGKQLAGLHATLAVAESATGGGLAERITSVPGSSALVSRRLRHLHAAHEDRIAGRSRRDARRFGAVSAETAEAMAMGARRRTGATWALSVTGNAGPTTDGERGAGRHDSRGISGPAETISFHRVNGQPAIARGCAHSRRRWLSIFYTGN